MREAILALLAGRPDRHVSGEEISKTLNISRTAVWKHIQELKKRGYRFESVPNKGYRLTGFPDRLSPEAIRLAAGQLSTLTEIRVHERLDSTQAEVHRLAASGAPHGTLVVAEEQTAGRGRHGRNWLSPPGKGIWMSLLVRPPLVISAAPQMTLVAATALCRALRRETGAEIGIKWPNDLLSGGKKLCGILVESVGEDEWIRHMAVGIGIDCNLEAEDYPPELAGKATSLLLETGRTFDRGALAGAVLREFDRLYGLYLAEGFSAIRSLWESMSVTIGMRVRHEAGGRLTEGIAEGLDERGALIVRTAEGERAIVMSGEVRVL